MLSHMIAPGARPAWEPPLVDEGTAADVHIVAVMLRAQSEAAKTAALQRRVLAGSR